MKELSIEEKAQRYDEAIKRVEDIKTGKCETRFMFTEGLFEHIFPALKESEDERIMGNIIATIHLYYGEPLEDEAKEMVAWLEKQGEQNLIMAKSPQLGEQKPVEHKEIPTDIRSIVDKEANAIWKEINTGHNHSIIDTFNQFYGICMQVAEAVMEYNKPAEWSEGNKKMLGKCIDAASGYYSPEDKQSMKSWLYSLKDKVQPQPKQEWSEEDENEYTHILKTLNLVAAEQETKGYNNLNSSVNWLKSLKERYTWKPSDEQLDALHDAAVYVDKSMFPYPKGILMKLYKQIKKLKGE